jgi:cytoskeletal protein RodZ
MSTVAEQLRQAREAQKLTIQHAAEVTKIRTDHLRALEEGNFDVFSAPVYIRGFVRGYAALLKLDVPQVMHELDGELAQTKKFAEPPPLTEHQRGPLDFLMLQFSKVDWRKGLVALAGLVVLGVLVSLGLTWRHYLNKDPLKDLPPGVYQSTQNTAGQTLPLPTPARR